MTIQAECPICRARNSLQNKRCTKCHGDIAAAKRRGIRYFLEYRLPNGKKKREFAGHSLREAKEKSSERTLQRAHGKLIGSLDQQTMTCQQVTDWYLGLEKTKGLSYYANMVYNFREINQELGQVRTMDLRQVDLENYQAKRKKRGLADSYIDKETGALHRAIKKAATNDKVPYEALRPFRNLSKMLKKKSSNARDRIITAEEFHTIMDAMKSSHAKQIWATGYYTGMRRNEIVTLTWSQVNLKRREITLEASMTKDDEARIVPIPSPLLDIFLDIPRDPDTDYIFLYKSIPVKSIRASLYTACKLTGIPYGRRVRNGLTFHDLRHTFVTNMRRAGTDETVIMKITGHSTREMFDRYNFVSDEEAVTAMKHLEDYLDRPALGVAHVSHRNS